MRGKSRGGVKLNLHLPNSGSGFHVGSSFLTAAADSIPASAAKNPRLPMLGYVLESDSGPHHRGR